MVVNAVKSDRYKSGFDDGADCSEAAWVDVGDLYADEERRFLLFLDMPAVDNANCHATRLIKVTCNYTYMASRQTVDVAPADGYANVQRPLVVTPTDVAQCVEVERELLRVAAAEDMALAREVVEHGAYDEAVRILDVHWESLSRSASALSDDTMCTVLAAELHKLSQRVSDECQYRKTGHTCLLTAMSSHTLQRGSWTVRYGCGVGSSSVFMTQAVQKMEKLSEMLHKRQEMPPWPPLPENGSKTPPPCSRLEARLASAVPRLSMLSRYQRLLLKR
jgi:hypothetical protein